MKYYSFLLNDTLFGRRICLIIFIALLIVYFVFHKLICTTWKLGLGSLVYLLTPRRGLRIISGVTGWLLSELFVLFLTSRLARQFRQGVRAWRDLNRHPLPDYDIIVDFPYRQEPSQRAILFFRRRLQAVKKLKSNFSYLLQMAARVSAYLLA